MNSRRLLSSALLASFAAAVLSASTASAATIAWWRMGDDDGLLTQPPVDGAAITVGIGTLNNPIGSAGPLVPSSGGAAYSTDVPGPYIHNPQTGQTVPNGWSMHSDGTVNKQRMRITNLNVPSVFTYEAFVKFPDVSASAGIDFAYQRTNADGGWQLELNGDETVELNMISQTSSGTSTLDIDSTATLSDGQWHHVAVVYEGNSQDGSDDVHLFIDHQLDSSGNVPDANTIGGFSTTFYNGSTLHQHAAWVDESRYLDDVLPLNASGFLTAVPEPSSLACIAGILLGCVGRSTQGRKPMK